MDKKQLAMANVSAITTEINTAKQALARVTHDYRGVMAVCDLVVPTLNAKSDQPSYFKLSDTEKQNRIEELEGTVNGVRDLLNLISDSMVDLDEKTATIESSVDNSIKYLTGLPANSQLAAREGGM